MDCQAIAVRDGQPTQRTNTIRHATEATKAARTAYPATTPLCGASRRAPSSPPGQPTPSTEDEWRPIDTLALLAKVQVQMAVCVMKVGGG